jgi:hypothetical protein
MSSVIDFIQARSNFWQELNYSLIRFDRLFVTGNVINASISGIAISPVTYATSQLNTINLLIASINNTGVAIAEVYSFDTSNKTIKVTGLLDSLVNIDSIVVTAGSVQPVATIVLSKYGTLLSQATLIVGSAFASCGQTNYAIALVMMHWLTLQSQSGTGNAQSGVITSKREGDLAISYAHNTSNNSNGYWGQTSYGQEYLQLKRSCFMTVRNRMFP